MDGKSKNKGNQTRDWPKSENDIVIPEEKEEPVKEETPTPPQPTVINDLNNGDGIKRV